MSCVFFGGTRCARFRVRRYWYWYDTNEETRRSTDRWIHGPTDRWIHGPTNRRTDEPTDRRTDGPTNRRTDEPTDN